MKEKLCSMAEFKEVVITDTCGVSTVYANDGGVILSIIGARKGPGVSVLLALINFIFLQILVHGIQHQTFVSAP